MVGATARRMWVLAETETPITTACHRSGRNGLGKPIPARSPHGRAGAVDVCAAVRTGLRIGEGGEADERHEPEHRVEKCPGSAQPEPWCSHAHAPCFGEVTRRQAGAGGLHHRRWSVTVHGRLSIALSRRYHGKLNNQARTDRLYRPQSSAGRTPRTHSSRVIVLFLLHLRKSL